MEVMYAPEQMDEVSRNLFSEGLVEPVFPAMFIHSAERFDDCFIEFIEKRVLPSRTRRGGGASQPKLSRIHAEKMGSIPDFLVDAGLARRVNWGWYDVDAVVANHFMAYLATVLAAIPEVDATPLTDKANFAITLGSKRPAYRQKKNLIHEFKAREVILKSLLPIPAGQIRIDELIRFKQNHGHLLPKLRAKIEAQCSQIALLPDPIARLIATSAFIEECQDQVAEIEETMRPAFGKVVCSSITPLFGAGLTLHATAQGNAIGYAGAALSLAGAAYHAIASIRAPRIAHSVKPLAYIAHAHRLLL
jgi:hypothetical protein